MTTVDRALNQLMTSGDLHCGPYGSVLTLDLQRPSGTERMADDFYSSCPWEIRAGSSQMHYRSCN